MAGRQLAVTLYGYLWSDSPRVTQENGATIGNYRSLELDFPVIEYKAGHAFSEKLAFGFAAQFGYAIEIPTSVGLDTKAFTSINDSSIIYLRFSLEGIKYW